MAVDRRMRRGALSGFAALLSISTCFKTSDAARPVLAIEHVVRAAILAKDGVGARVHVMEAAGLLAAFAIADAAQDRLAGDQEFDLAAAAGGRFYFWRCCHRW